MSVKKSVLSGLFVLQCSSSLSLDPAKTGWEQVGSCMRQLKNPKGRPADSVELEGVGDVSFDVNWSLDRRFFRLVSKECLLRVLLHHTEYRKVTPTKIDETSISEYWEIPDMRPCVYCLGTMEWATRNRAISSILSELKKVHDLGFALHARNHVSEKFGISGDSKFLIRIEGMEDLSLMRYDHRGRRLPLKDRMAYKSDLYAILDLVRGGSNSNEKPTEILRQKREVPNWLDPLLAFEDAIESAPFLFNHDYWIRLFADLSELQQDGQDVERILGRYWTSKAVDPRKPKESVADAYWNQVESCTRNPAAVPCDKGVWDGCVVEGRRMLYGADQSGVESRGGVSGNAFPSRDGTIFLKVAHMDKGTCETQMKSVCVERTTLSLLNGLDGLVPRELPLKDFSEGCSRISVLEESAGRYVLADTYSKLSPSALMAIVSRMIAIVEKLSQVGFMQNDLHMNNFLFSNMEDPAGTLKLIDFGFALPLRDANGNNLRTEGWRNLVKVNMLRLGDMIELFIRSEDDSDEDRSEKSPGPMTVLYDEYLEAINQLGLFDEPDYEKWISKFAALSQIVSVVSMN